MTERTSDKPLPPTPRTDWVWNNTPNEDLARDLFNLSSQIERELAESVSHIHPYAKIVDQARQLLKKAAPQADQEHGLTSIRSTPVQPAGAAPNAATDAALIKGSPKHSDDMPRSVAAPVCVELTFGALRRANVARCIKWNPEGIASWSPSDWLTAVTGELGELASLLKMRNRERDGLPGNKFSPTDKQIADELADVLTYLDLLAEVLGVDLGRAAVEKFNEVSVRVGFPDRIDIAPQPAVRATEYICDKCGIRVDPHRCAGEATF